MRLSTNFCKLFFLGLTRVVTALRERRAVIRDHRDQRGDNRCWVDDECVWAMLADSPPPSTMPPPFEVAMAQCRLFYDNRRTEHPDPTPIDILSNQTKWDADLEYAQYTDLVIDLARVQKAIKRHRDITGRPRTVNDDRLLYQVLPEHLPADFRRPPTEEFLGEARAPHAGCPAFWRSHQHCQTNAHDLHRWGPCR